MQKFFDLPPEAAAAPARKNSRVLGRDGKA
jgi:hypothetical protein